MAYLHPFLRVIAGGTLFGTEQFAIGINLINPGQTEHYSAGQDGVDADVVTALSTFWAAASISSDAHLTYVKMNEISVDGKYFDQENSWRQDLVTAVPGGAGNVHLPAQIAMAVTLATSAARGLAHKGRFYLPVPAIQADTSGRMTAAFIASQMTLVTTLLNSINTAMDVWRVGVVSNVRGGGERPVINARIGRVYDTIRSRRNALVEDYTDGATLNI